MKVVHLISGGDIGGAKTHIETLLPKLNKIHGMEAHLLCVMEGALTEECRGRGIAVTVIPQKKRYDLTIIKKMADWLSEEGFDIVHCHGARANFIAFFLRFYVKIPMLTTLHSDYRLDFKGSGYRQWLYTPLNIFSLKRFRYFIAVSEVFKRMLTERGFEPKRIEVIHNGIDFQAMEPKKDRKSFLTEMGVKCGENTVIIGCCSRLHPIKGIDILIQAAKLLFTGEKPPPDAIVLIAGDGAEMKSLSKEIEKNGLTERVKLLGYVKDISSFYEAIDINVLPSRSEGIPMTLIEGAKMKLNTIASDTGGIPEVITHPETGTLFPVGDWERLAKILAHEIESPADGKERGERLYEDAVVRFSAQKMAEAHMAFYKRIIKEKDK